MVVPEGMVMLLVQTRDKVVKVDFIVVNACSPYTAILLETWLNSIGPVPSSLHLKVKYPTTDGVGELIRSQSMARLCLVVTM